MQAATILMFAAAMIGAICLIGGVYVLAGIGWSLILAGLLCLVLVRILAVGMTGRG